MRKIIIIIILLSLSASAAFSQSLEWGIKAGMNLSCLKAYRKTDVFPGFYAGVFAERRISDSFGVQGELLYSKTLESTSGWEGTKKGSDPNNMDYLVLPVMAKYYAVKDLGLELGPQFGYLLRDDINHFDKKFDLSLGAGLSCKIGRRFDVSARYNFGLIDLSKEFDGKNNTLRFGVGYRF